MKNAILLSIKSFSKLTLLAALLTACAAKPPADQAADILFSKKASEEKALEDYTKLALAYLSKNNISRAKRHAVRALDIDSSDANANHVMALVYQVEGEIALAEKYFLNAIRSDDTLSKAKNNYAVMLFKQERFEDACKWLTEVVKDTLYEARASAFENLGQCSVRLGKFAQAENAYLRALQLDPKRYDAYLELAYVYYEQQSFAKAMRTYQRHKQSQPATPKSLYLALKLAEAFDDKDLLASSYLLMKNQFPYSDELAKYNLEKKQTQTLPKQ